MDNNIILYQKGYKSVIERLKTDEEILAVMVFGSMVTGDFWEKSDIDLFVVIDRDIEGVRNIYTEENNISVHIKLVSKEKFIKLYKEDLKGGFIQRMIATSRLVFSKDSEITLIYDEGRYYPDIDREKWNMVYLGNVLKRISVCKKYLHTDGIYTAYSATVRCIEEFAKLYINYSGYMISKDAITMAVNLDDNFTAVVDELFMYKGDIKVAIKNTIDYMENSIDDKLSSMTALILNFLKDNKGSFSAEEIKISLSFQNFNIEFEEILDRLYEKKLINKASRDFNDIKGKMLFKENVYSHRG